VFQNTIDDIEQDLDAIQRDHALTDRAVAAAIQLFVRTGEFPENSVEERDVEESLLEAAWLFFLAAPAAEPRYLLVSSMHMSMVLSGERALSALFDELRDLDESDSSKTLDDFGDWLDDYRGIGAASLPDDNRAENIRQRFDRARTLLQDHHEDVLELSREVLDSLATDFDRDVETGALSPLGADADVDLDDPDEVLEAAENRQREGDLDGARHLYSRVLRERPDDIEARVQRGILRATLEDLEGACTDFDRVLELDDDHLVARLNRGLARHSLGDVKDAIDDYNHALTIVDDDPEIWTNRGIARFSDDNYEGALHDLNKAIELDDTMATAFFQRGNVRRVVKDVGPAIDDYDRAIDLEPEFADAYAARGFLYLQMEDADQAREDFDEAIELRPSDPELYYNRAYTHMLNDDVEAAIDDYDSALELDAEDVEALTNRGAAHMMNGDLEQAAEDWERAIAINPYYPTPYLKRASMWIATEDYEQAVEDLEIALEHAPDDWPHRSKVQETLDDLREEI